MQAFYTVYTSDGKEWESVVDEYTDEEVQSVLELCQSVTRLNYLSIPTLDSLGRKSNVYFNPQNIVAVRFTKVDLND